MPTNVTPNAFIIKPASNIIEQYPALRHASHALALKYAHKELVTEAELQNMGHMLWQSLDLTAEFEQAKQAAGVQTLPLIIESDDPALHQLPGLSHFRARPAVHGREGGVLLL